MAHWNFLRVHSHQATAKAEIFFDLFPLIIFTARKRSSRRLCFYMCLSFDSVHRGGGMRGRGGFQWCWGHAFQGGNIWCGGRAWQGGAYVAGGMRWWGGASVAKGVQSGGHACFYSAGGGACVVLFGGGVLGIIRGGGACRVFSVCSGYDEIRVNERAVRFLLECSSCCFWVRNSMFARCESNVAFNLMQWKQDMHVNTTVGCVTGKRSK